jgi:hypothetical protein
LEKNHASTKITRLTSRIPIQQCWKVLSRRLDDRIRSLCSKVTSASEDEVEPLLKELQSAIREKIESVRRLAVRQLIQREKAEQRRAS